MKLIKLSSIIFTFFLVNNAFAQSIQSEAFSLDLSSPTIPACQNNSSDQDGDGWGWENAATCHVGGEFSFISHPFCTSNSSDSDGDGWGWENNKTCMVTEEDIDDSEIIEEDTDEIIENFDEEPELAPAISVTTPSNNNQNSTPTSRRASLLESPWKMGYGAATTGAGYDGQLYVVTNTNDSGSGSLREGLTRANTWVTYDPSLDGNTIYIKSTIVPAKNVTWDGRDALVRIAPQINSANPPYGKHGMWMIRLSNSNMIIHRVRLGLDDDRYVREPFKTAHVTVLHVSSGRNYWIDHVEISNNDDDSIGIGNYSTQSAVDITVTHYKVYSANKGLLIASDQKTAQNAGRKGRVTIAWSDLAATCRNFRNSGANWVHGFNNYTHDFGGDECGTIAGHGEGQNRDGTDTPIVLAESSVYEDSNKGLVGDLAGPSSIPGLPVQGYVFTDGENIFLGGSGQNNSVIDPGSSRNVPVARPRPDYSYPKMDSSRVKSYVLSNAGVHGDNIIYP